MAPISILLPVLLAAQAYSLTLPTPSTTAAGSITRGVQSAITPAPAVTSTVCADDLHNYVAKSAGTKRRFFCPGVVAGLDGDDVSHAYCCVNAVYLPEIPLTSWYYNHTGVAIPSTVITPSCVQPIPLTASNYDALARAAAPQVTPGAQVPMVAQPADIEVGDGPKVGSFATTTQGAAGLPATTAAYSGVRFEGAAEKREGKSMAALVVALAGVLVGGVIA